MTKVFLFGLILLLVFGCGGGGGHSPTNPLPNSDKQKQATGDQPFSGLMMLSREDAFEVFKKNNWRLYGLFPSDCSLDPRKSVRAPDYMEARDKTILFHLAIDKCFEEYVMDKSVSLESDILGRRLQLVASNPHYIKRCPDSVDKQPEAIRTLGLELDYSRKYVKVNLMAFRQCYWAELVTE